MDSIDSKPQQHARISHKVAEAAAEGRPPAAIVSPKWLRRTKPRPPDRFHEPSKFLFSTPGGGGVHKGEEDRSNRDLVDINLPEEPPSRNKNSSAAEIAFDQKGGGGLSLPH